MDSRLQGMKVADTESDSIAAADLDATASLRKRWLYLLPAVFVTYSLAYLDRANYGFGAAAGLATTLHITEKQASLLGSLFFLGYFAFQVPGAVFARKRSASRLVFFALIAWGSLAALTGVVRTFWLLALVRLLLGIAESLIFPAMLLLLTRWFTRTERSRANSILILGNPVTVLWMSAITGYLIQGFGWQKTFIIEGIPSILWAVVWILFVRDKPSEAGWMTPGAKESLERQLAQEQLTVAPVRGMRIALLRERCASALGAVFFLEPWRLRICALAADDRATRECIRDGQDRVALSSSVSGSNYPYAAGIADL